MRIGICGAGWLGRPLALSFNNLGHSVFVSKRNINQVEDDTLLDLHVCQFTLGQDLTAPALQNLFSCDLLILNIAPGRRTLDAQMFVQQMQALIKHCRASNTQKLIFISTTSVYGDAQGVVDERTLPQPLTESAKAHVLIEAYIRDTFEQDATILRLAGLVGEDRHPVRSLAGKTGLHNGLSPVNLIHRQDAIAAVHAIAQKKYFGKTLHLSAIEHPNRHDYYRWCARELGIVEPTFVEEQEPSGKAIDATETIRLLGLQLTFASPYNMLQGLTLLK